ncbi:MAG: hypothetical protein K0R54_1179 [Clostridiaceae bacterium]|jgi:hypothetical protein|nr:hypothetical protein [Clostridiaceae bacterium]
MEYNYSKHKRDADLMNISRLTGQHIEIRDEVNKLKLLIPNDVISDSFELAKEICFMAGKLKIHLQSQDKYLYHKLLENSNLIFILSSFL